MQHDLFHVYTVDQHILQVLRNLQPLLDERVCPRIPHVFAHDH
jgi:[protein-PII] uridylyltransferase